MPVDQRTPNLNLSLPYSTNQLEDDVERLRSTIGLLDTAVAGKANAADLTAHTSSTTNPHATTAAQVGALSSAPGSVTDTNIGDRTATVASVPAGQTGSLTQWVSWFTNRLKAITGGANWYDTPPRTMAQLSAHVDISPGNPHGTTAASIGAIAANNDSVTDPYIGNRTADQTQNPAGNTGSLSQWLNWFANRIKAIVGQPNWYDAPPANLTALGTHLNSSSNPHNTTLGQLGDSTLNPTLIPSGNTGPALYLLSWLANRIKAITGTTNWYDDPVTTIAALKTTVDGLSGTSGIPQTAGSVSDFYIGQRTINPSLTPSGNSGQLVELVSWFANRIKAITGTTYWYDAPAATIDSLKSDVLALQAGGGGGTVPDGSITDLKIGTRTISQNSVPDTTSVGQLTTLLSNLANRIKAITGSANWYDNPAANLSGLNSSLTSHTGAGAPHTGHAALAGNSAQTFSVGTPTNAVHAINKGYADSNYLAGGAGTVTDSLIGNRTITLPGTAPSSDTGTISALFNWLAYQIKAITGGTYWYSSPATTLAACWSHITATAPHSGHAALAGNTAVDFSGRSIYANSSSSGAFRYIGSTGYWEMTSAAGAARCPTSGTFYTLTASGNGIPIQVGAANIGGAVFPYSDNGSGMSCGKSTNRWTAVYSVTGTIQTSDKRLKTDIADSPLGLDFVNRLRPVSYRWIVGGRDVSVTTTVDPKTGQYVDDKVEVEKPGNRTHFGMLSQDVKAVLDELGVPDFGGWVLEDPSNPDSRQSLRYDQFIAPLVKAIQELSVKIASLESRVQ